MSDIEKEDFFVFIKNRWMRMVMIFLTINMILPMIAILMPEQSRDLIGNGMYTLFCFPVWMLCVYLLGTTSCYKRAGLNYFLFILFVIANT